MNALASVVLATAIEACAQPTIIPWRPGPRDTVFVELEHGDKGCIFIADEPIPGPPYVLSAAFAARPDSLYLGLAINRIVPPGLEAGRDAGFVTPERARRFVFVHRAFQIKGEPYRNRRLDDVVKTIALDERVAAVRVDSTGGYAQTITIRWKDEPLPWKAEVSLPYFVQMPGDPKGDPLRKATGPMIVIPRGGSIEYIRAGAIRYHGRICPKGTRP